MRRTEPWPAIPAGRMLAIGALMVGGLFGCAPRNAGFDPVETVLRERAALDAEWRALAPDPLPDDRATALIGGPIGADEAVDIALARNSELQARFENLGIARGALVDASLPENVEIEGDIGNFPGPRSDFGFAATMDLTSWLFLPMRRGVESAAMDATQIETAGSALELAHEVRVAFYEYQAAEQLFELDRSVLDAATASHDTARRLYDAGNITALELAHERAYYEEVRGETVVAEATALNRREELNVWMGLSGPETGWQSEGRLPEPPAEEEIPDIETLEGRAIESSLDLRALEFRFTEAARRANLARAEGLLPSLRAGAQVGREESLRQTGPVIAIEIPLFDQGQGRVASARARMRQVEQEYAASAVRIRAAVRAARNDVVIATRRVDHYRMVLLPLREQIVDETQRQYNAMQTGVFELLVARREQIRVAQDYVLALRDYWRARSELDQILAGRLVGSGQAFGRWNGF